MFTGLIRELGVFDGAERSDAGGRLRIRAALASALAGGDSVAVSGVCLTVAEAGGGTFTADVMNQTLALTTLGALGEGDAVNLEPALRAGDALGGHLVQGHVDATAEVLSAEADGLARRLAVGLPEELTRYVVEHGSIALDGVSLTVAACSGTEVEVSLIPETLERTTLGGLGPGDRVNVEVDQIARYVERLVQGFGKEGSNG